MRDEHNNEEKETDNIHSQNKAGGRIQIFRSNIINISVKILKWQNTQGQVIVMCMMTDFTLAGCSAIRLCQTWGQQTVRRAGWCPERQRQFLKHRWDL